MNIFFLNITQTIRCFSITESISIMSNEKVSRILSEGKNVKLSISNLLIWIRTLEFLSTLMCYKYLFITFNIWWFGLRFVWGFPINWTSLRSLLNDRLSSFRRHIKGSYTVLHFRVIFFLESLINNLVPADL